MHGLGNLAGWQWLFILEGIPAILMGVVVWFYLPDYPETAKFLTSDEREFASKRMGKFAPKGTDKHFDKADFLATIKAWQFWVFAVSATVCRAKTTLTCEEGLLLLHDQFA